MILTTIAAFAIGFQGVKAGPTFCPSTLEEVVKPAIAMNYGGAVYTTCCGGCDKPFLKDPQGSIAKAVKAKKVIGVFSYDPVSGQRIDTKDAAAYSDYKSLRYFFASAAEKKQFDGKPENFVSAIKSEAYFCPVMNHATDSKAGAFADFNGTRYYLCCGDCLGAFKKDPAKFAPNAKAAVKPLSAAILK